MREPALPTRVLVVDDLADNRELLVELLEEEHEVATAADGHEALAAIAAGRPDVVLLDLMMPGLDGFGVLERLVDVPGAPPVVVVSAAGEREPRLRALRLGAADFVSKPFDQEELRVRVRNVVRARRAEEAERRHRELVELEVASRTEELRAALADLERADRYKDEFLSVLSHELRTPLNFITGFASCLGDGLYGPLVPGQAQAVEKILNGAERMLLLVDDLLDVARIESGELHLDVREADAGAVVEEVLSALAPLADQKGLHLAADAAPGAWPMDARRVSQVLANLVANAIKFTHAGSVRVRCRATEGGLRFEVSDTGVGVSQADQARIFDRFQQADMSRTRASGGVGLGLAIARALVAAHGGRIGVDSVLGEGSTFWFTLPSTRPAAGPWVPLAARQLTP